jgi:hypothetical protein
MKNDWRDYVIPVVACIVFPVFIPVAIGIVLFLVINAVSSTNKENE